MTKNVPGGVYCIRNNVNGMMYVGTTTRLIERWRLHRYQLKDGVHHNKKLQNDWDHYGEQCFTFSILETAPSSTDLDMMEKRWLDRYPPETLYSISRHIRPIITNKDPERYNLNISVEVYQRLKRMGKFGESYNDVISRALDALEENKDD